MIYKGSIHRSIHTGDWLAAINQSMHRAYTTHLYHFVEVLSYVPNEEGDSGCRLRIKSFLPASSPGGFLFPEREEREELGEPCS